MPRVVKDLRSSLSEDGALAALATVLARTSSGGGKASDDANPLRTGEEKTLH